MSGEFVNKTIVDRDRIKAKKNQTVYLLRYTGNNLTGRDLRKIIEVVYRNFEELNTSPELDHTRYNIAKVLTSPDGVSIFAVIDGIIVAYLLAESTILENSQQYMHIYYLYTSPMYRGNGIATYLLNMIQRYAEELNINTLSLTFDTQDKELEKFYLKNYFIYDDKLRSYQRYDMLVKYI